MKQKHYLILGILLLIVIGIVLVSNLIPKQEKQKTLLDNKEIFCDSSKEKAREVCLSYAVNKMDKSIVWAGTHIVCEENLCKVIN